MQKGIKNMMSPSSYQFSEIKKSLKHFVKILIENFVLKYGIEPDTEHWYERKQIKLEFCKSI